MNYLYTTILAKLAVINKQTRQTEFNFTFPYCEGKTILYQVQALYKKATKYENKQTRQTEFNFTFPYCEGKTILYQVQALYKNDTKRNFFYFKMRFCSDNKAFGITVWN
jgi:hypothetical protein